MRPPAAPPVGDGIPILGGSPFLKSIAARCCRSSLSLSSCPLPPPVHPRVSILRPSVYRMRTRQRFRMPACSINVNCRCTSDTRCPSLLRRQSLTVGENRVLLLDVPKMHAFAIHRFGACSFENHGLKMRCYFAAQDGDERRHPTPHEQHHRDRDATVHQVVVREILNVAVKKRASGDQKRRRDDGSPRNAFPVEPLARNEAVDQIERCEHQQYANQLRDHRESSGGLSW